jgi:AraC-like DNA-binding protein
VRKVWMAIAPDGSAHGPFEGQKEALTFVSAQFPAPALTPLSPTSSEPEQERRTRRVWTDADEARARALWGRGLTDSAIAREMDKDRGALARRLRNLGLAPNDGPRQPRPAKVKTASKSREVQGHGTNASYARGCRCDECKEAARAYQREYVARRRAEGPPADKHGTAYGYTLGCNDRSTCPATPTCVDAMLEQDIARRREKGIPEQAPRVPAQPTRDHLRALMAGGMTIERIAAEAGVSRSILATVLYGRSGARKGVEQTEIKADTASRVLALTVKAPVA